MAAERRMDGWRLAGLTGAALLCAALVGAGVAGGEAWRGWTAAAFLAISAPAGGVGLLMILRLVPGEWRRELGGLLEALVRLLPLGVVLGLPVLFVLAWVYPWTHEHQPTAFRAAYLSQPFFIGRAIVWWSVLAGLAALLDGSERRQGVISAIGLILFAALGTTAAVDWLMSLDPGFNSSGFGLYVIAVQVLLALGLCVAAATRLPVLLARPGVLGAVLLTALMVWAYLAFMQYVIVWSGDLPKGAAWYLRRGRDGWDLVMWAVAASRLVPLLLLLSGKVRAGRSWLLWIALSVMAGTVAEIAWIALPGDDQASPSALAVYAAATLGCALFGGAVFRHLLGHGGPRPGPFAEPAPEGAG